MGSVIKFSADVIGRCQRLHSPPLPLPFRGGEYFSLMQNKYIGSRKAVDFCKIFEDFCPVPELRIIPLHIFSQKLLAVGETFVPLHPLNPDDAPHCQRESKTLIKTK